MDTYICFQTILMVVVTLIQLVARLLIHKSKFLACTDQGWIWLHTSIIGSFFFLFHMMVIVMQFVMIERVFYSVPHKMGWFNHMHAEALKKLAKKDIMAKLDRTKVAAPAAKTPAPDNEKPGSNLAEPKIQKKPTNENEE